MVISKLSFTILLIYLFLQHYKERYSKTNNESLNLPILIVYLLIVKFHSHNQHLFIKKIGFGRYYSSNCKVTSFFMLTFVTSIKNNL